MAPSAYPPGVPDRRRRPRRKVGDGLLYGAILGGLLGRSMEGALAGGMLGHAAENAVPVRLDEAVREECVRLGVQLVNLYRHGPYRAEALFLFQGGYWTVEARAPKVPGWQQEALEDWLFGELVDYQLEPWLNARGVAIS